MKKIILLLWIVLYPMASIVAQSSTENKNDYDQLNEWAVVKLTIAYMEDLYSFTPIKKGDKGSDAEYKTYKTLSDKYQNYSFEKKINLFNVGQLLKNGDWATTKKDVFDKYEIYFFTPESSFNDVAACGYKGGNAKKNFTNAKEAIIKEKNKQIQLQKEIIDLEAVNRKNRDQELKDLDQTSGNDSSERTSDLPFWIYVILGVLVSSLVLLIKKNRNLKGKLEKRIKQSQEKMRYSNQDNIRTSNLDENRKLKENIQCLKNDNKDLKEENETLKVRLENIATEEGVKINKTHNSESPSQAIDLEFHQPKANNLIYLPSPFRNLTFANEDASKEKSLNSLYQVDLNEQTKTGVFTILEGADLSKALNSPDTFLETACVYDNEYFNNARAIKVIEKGEIKLNGEDWIVTKKVRIKFI